MRVKLHNVKQSAALLGICKDRMTTDTDSLVTLNSDFGNVVHNTDDLQNHVYPDLQIIRGIKNGCVNGKYQHRVKL